MVARVVLDANVLYAARLRDLWMELAVSDLVDVFWTSEIETEWIGAVCRTRPELRNKLRRTARLMRSVLPEALVDLSGFDLTALSSPDVHDRYVIAAAITGEADTIVTFNISDFAARDLQRRNIVAMTPDALFVRLAFEDAEEFLNAAERVRSRLKHPAITLSEYAQGLRRAGCPEIAEWLLAGTRRF